MSVTSDNQDGASLRRIFAIADLHLSCVRPKPMEVFGAHWQNHQARIEQSWREQVLPDDIVLVAGDISWALKLDEALPDLRWVEALPGRKVFVKGNHDYWWSSIGKVRAAAGEGMHFIQNDVVYLDGVAVGGARLWDFPGVSWSVPEDAAADAGAPGADQTVQPATPVAAGRERVLSPEQLAKVRARELERLRLSLSKLPAEAGVRIALVHFPPIGADGEPTQLTEIMDGFDIDICVFGHLHPRCPDALSGTDQVMGRTRYVLVSCDTIAFAPRCVWPGHGRPSVPAGGPCAAPNTGT